MQEIEKTTRILNIPFMPAKNLAGFVIAFRALGIDKEFAILCMQELCKRRELGSNFDYETYIEEELQKIPKSTPIDLKSITNLIKNAR